MLLIQQNLKASSGSNTGTLSATLDTLTSAASGVVGHSGASAVTLDSVSIAFSGVIGHSGTSAITLDGVSVSASGSVAGSVAITGDLAITLDGIAFDATSSSVVAGGYDDKKKKRYLVRVGNKLLSFANEQDAIAAIERDEPEKQYPTKKAKKQKAVTVAKPTQAKPDETFNLNHLLELARMYNEQHQYETLLRNRRYEAAIALYEALMQREEEDIELLLMAA